LEGVDVLFGLPPIAFDMFLLFCINEGNQKTLQQLAVHVVDLSPNGREESHCRLNVLLLDCLFSGRLGHCFIST
jgi:hypothetical protein